MKIKLRLEGNEIEVKIGLKIKENKIKLGFFIGNKIRKWNNENKMNFRNKKQNKITGKLIKDGNKIRNS